MDKNNFIEIGFLQSNSVKMWMLLLWRFLNFLQLMFSATYGRISVTYRNLLVSQNKKVYKNNRYCETKSTQKILHIESSQLTKNMRSKVGEKKKMKITLQQIDKGKDEVIINMYRMKRLKSMSGNHIDVTMDNGEHVFLFFVPNRKWKFLCGHSRYGRNDFRRICNRICTSIFVGKLNEKALLIWTLCVGGLCFGCILLYTSYNRFLCCCIYEIFQKGFVGIGKS